MDIEVLRIFGQIAGLAGLSLGVVLLLFRDVIRKNIFSSLTQEHSYQLLRLILILVWSLAIIGVGSWTYANSQARASFTAPSPGATPSTSVQPVPGDPQSQSANASSSASVQSPPVRTGGNSTAEPTPTPAVGATSQVASQNPNLSVPPQEISIADYNWIVGSWFDNHPDHTEAGSINGVDCNEQLFIAYDLSLSDSGETIMGNLTLTERERAISVSGVSPPLICYQSAADDNQNVYDCTETYGVRVSPSESRSIANIDALVKTNNCRISIANNALTGTMTMKSRVESVLKFDALNEEVRLSRTKW